MKTRAVIFSLLTYTVSVSSFGHAAATEWQVNANGRVRLISGEDRVWRGCGISTECEVERVGRDR